MLRYLKCTLDYLHDEGIPLPLFRDKGKGSLSMTLVVVSFSIFANAIFKEKASDALMYAAVLFGMCGSMYFGKKWQVRKIGTMEIGDEEVDSKGKKE